MKKFALIFPKEYNRSVGNFGLNRVALDKEEQMLSVSEWNRWEMKYVCRGNTDMHEQVILYMCIPFSYSPPSLPSPLTLPISPSYPIPPCPTPPSLLLTLPPSYSLFRGQKPLYDYENGFPFIQDQPETSTTDISDREMYDMDIDHEDQGGSPSGWVIMM